MIYPHRSLNILSILFVVIFIGCRQEAVEPVSNTPTEQTSGVLGEADVLAPTDAPTQAKATATLSGTETTTAPSDCMLPCWNGIVPGETTSDEARSIFQATLLETITNEHTYEYEVDTRPYKTEVYKLGEERQIWVAYDLDNDIVVAINLAYVALPEAIFITPAQVFQEFGAPHLMMLGPVTSGVFETLLVYKTGVTFRYTQTVDGTDRGDGSFAIDYCVDDSNWFKQGQDAIFFDVYLTQELTEPVDIDIAETAVQYFTSIKDLGYFDVEELLGVSEETITEAMLSQEEACWQIVLD